MPAGATLLINSKSGANIKDWSILIGCHSDDLSGCSELKRWPCVTIQKQLLSDLVILSSPFGGNLYLIQSELIQNLENNYYRSCLCRKS